MQPRIRPFEARDAEAVVDLSLRAWAPVFASLERVLGSGIFGRLHPDWREDQRRAVEDVCASQKTQVWVAEVGGATVGFVATDVFDPKRSMGEISMLTVDPDHQGGGIGTALTEFALDRLKDTGMTVAVVETGGDPGHAAARRTYEKAGYTLLPIARYFKNLCREGPWYPGPIALFTQLLVSKILGTSDVSGSRKSISRILHSPTSIRGYRTPAGGELPSEPGLKSTQIVYGGSVALGYDLVSGLIALPG